MVLETGGEGKIKCKYIKEWGCLNPNFEIINPRMLITECEFCLKAREKMVQIEAQVMANNQYRRRLRDEAAAKKLGA